MLDKIFEKPRYIAAAVGFGIQLQGVIFTLIEPSLFSKSLLVAGIVLLAACLHVEIGAFINRNRGIAWAFAAVLVVFAAIRITALQSPSDSGDSAPTPVLKEVAMEPSHEQQRREDLVPTAAVDEESADPHSGVTDNYDRDVQAIRRAVIADTIDPGSARFCPRFEVIRNRRGRQVYVGWYTSRDLRGRTGKDNIIAEVSDDGRVLQLDIGTP